MVPGTDRIAAVRLDTVWSIDDTRSIRSYRIARCPQAFAMLIITPEKDANIAIIRALVPQACKHARARLQILRGRVATAARNSTRHSSCKTSTEQIRNDRNDLCLLFRVRS
jgi:hypothetical protein